MHTWSGETCRIFHHSYNTKGDVILQLRVGEGKNPRPLGEDTRVVEMEEAEWEHGKFVKFHISVEDLLNFVAATVVHNKIESLEQANPRQILGLPDNP